MWAAVLGFIAYSLVMGFALPGIDNAAHLGGLAGGFLLGAGFAIPLGTHGRVGWRRVRQLTMLVLSAGLGLALWWQAPPMPEPRLQARQMAVFDDVLMRFSQAEPALLQEQQSLVQALRARQVSEGRALDVLERELIPAWERQIMQLSWAQPLPERQWEQQELIRYATARRDALHALVQAIQTRDGVWVERTNALQAQAEQILVQIRLRASLARSRAP
jgi:rhomboid protease GluP